MHGRIDYFELWTGKGKAGEEIDGRGWVGWRGEVSEEGGIGWYCTFVDV